MNLVVAGTVRSHMRPGSNDVGGLTIARGLTACQTRLAGDSDNFVVADMLRVEYGQQAYRGDGADNVIAFTENYEAAINLRGPMGVRRLTPLECERLMGWPDDFTRWTADGRQIPDSHRYRLCGNGVVSTVAEWIGHRLVAVESAA